jgi:hypothetical protein
VHRDAVCTGLASGDIPVCDALMDMCAQFGDLEMASRVFELAEHHMGSYGKDSTAGANCGFGCVRQREAVRTRLAQRTASR